MVVKELRPLNSRHSTTVSLRCEVVQQLSLGGTKLLIYTVFTLYQWMCIVSPDYQVGTGCINVIVASYIYACTYIPHLITSIITF